MCSINTNNSFNDCILLIYNPIFTALPYRLNTILFIYICIKKNVNSKYKYFNEITKYNIDKLKTYKLPKHKQLKLQKYRLTTNPTYISQYKLL